MGGEKQGSKGGGRYVGGFLQMFDWNVKSRKKLFSSKSDLPDQPKQKKRTDWNLPSTRLSLMDEDELLAGSSIKGSSDYSCASSVTDDEGCGARAPGVVARLMGLDSLPTSNVAEPFCSPSFDSQSLRSLCNHQRNLEFQHDQQIMHSGHLRSHSTSKVEAPVKRVTEPVPQKMVNRPIEKFQSEILPPKSAKSIPITHHKLLSPIKSPGFIPSKSAAHIMEAAAKIIEPGPQSTNNAKMPLLGTSTVPLKVRELKEKAEAAQKPSIGVEASSFRRPMESTAAKFLKGQSINKSCNGSVEQRSSRVTSVSDDNSVIKNKEKSVSLALQAKVNVQRREAFSSSDSRSIFVQNDQNEVMSRQTFSCQANNHRSMQKKASRNNASSVLRQNNQKQNCPIDRQKGPSKSLISNPQGRKLLSGDSSSARHKITTIHGAGGSCKVGTRKLNPEVTDSRKEDSYSSTHSGPRKKRSLDGSFHLHKNQDVDSMLVDTTDKPIQYNAAVDMHGTLAEERKRKGLDVVSFTFTAPMTRSSPVGNISRLVSDKNNIFCADYIGKKVLINSDSTNGSKLSSPRCNVKGADALSILLEQKLRELTYGAESSRYRAGMAGNSASIFQDLVPKEVPMTPMSLDNKSLDSEHNQKLDGPYSSNFFSSNSQGIVAKRKLQGTYETEECGGTFDNETRKFLNCRHPSPISVLEPSFFTESCNSSDSAASNSIDGNKQCSSLRSFEVLGTSYSEKFHSVDADAEFSDSASSTSTRTVSRRKLTGGWELEYVNEILLNSELMFKDFALGHAPEIVNPHLFDQLENRKEAGDEAKLRRKVLFDCVSECMDLRCRRYASGGCRTWAKGLLTLRRREWLAEEIYKEISAWGLMGNYMVDDLVDKDMSSGCGKWLDFEVESFELGLQIEGRILDSLVNEVVADILLL